MARAPAGSAGRSGKATPLVLLLLLAIAAMAYYAIVPDCFRTRDGIRVELAARAAQRCDEVVRIYVDRNRMSPGSVTLAMIDAHLQSHDERPVEWPAGTDLSTFDASDTNGVSVVVLLRDGPRRVSAADLLLPDSP